MPVANTVVQQQPPVTVAMPQQISTQPNPQQLKDHREKLRGLAVSITIEGAKQVFCKWEDHLFIYAKLE